MTLGFDYIIFAINGFNSLFPFILFHIEFFHLWHIWCIYIILARMGRVLLVDKNLSLRYRVVCVSRVFMLLSKLRFVVWSFFIGSTTFLGHICAFKHGHSVWVLILSSILRALHNILPWIRIDCMKTYFVLRGIMSTLNSALPDKMLLNIII